MAPDPAYGRQLAVGCRVWKMGDLLDHRAPHVLQRLVGGRGGAGRGGGGDGGGGRSWVRVPAGLPGTPLDGRCWWRPPPVSRRPAGTRLGLLAAWLRPGQNHHRVPW